MAYIDSGLLRSGPIQGSDYRVYVNNHTRVVPGRNDDFLWSTLKLLTYLRPATLDEEAPTDVLYEYHKNQLGNYMLDENIADETKGRSIADYILYSGFYRNVRDRLFGTTNSSIEVQVMHLLGTDSDRAVKLVTENLITRRTSNAENLGEFREDITKYLEQRGVTASVWISRGPARQDLLRVIAAGNTENLNRQLVLLLPALLPELFNNDEPAGDQKELLDALREPITTNRIDKACIVLRDAEYKLINSVEYRTRQAKSYIDNISENIFSGRLEYLQREWDNLKDKIQRFESEIRNCTHSMEDVSSKIMMLKYKKESNEGWAEELLDYVTRTPGIEIRGSSQSELELVISTELANFDPDFYQVLRDNKSSWLYDNLYSIAESITFEEDDIEEHVEDYLLLLDALFASETLKLKLYSAFYVDFSNNHVSARDDSQASRRAIPNIHLVSYNCFGDNKPMIIDALAKADGVLALELLRNAVGSHNLAEAVTAERLFREIVSQEATEKRVFITPDNKELTYKDAIAYLKGETNNE